MATELENNSVATVHKSNETNESNMTNSKSENSLNEKQSNRAEDTFCLDLPDFAKSKLDKTLNK